MVVAGVVIQWWYHKSLRAKMRDSKYLIGIIVIPLTWIVQYLVYVDVIPLTSFLSAAFPWIPVQSGRTWLWNSFQFWQFGGVRGLVQMPAGMAQIAVAIALSYPLWYLLGIWFGRCLFGNKSYERGALWLFQSEKGAAPAPDRDPASDIRSPPQPASAL